MPRASVSSLYPLKEICFKFAITHIKDVFITRNVDRTRECLSKLSGNVLDRFIREIKHSSDCNNQLLLISGEQIKQIDLQGAADIRDTTLKTVVCNCPNVSKLSLSHCHHLEDATLASCIKRLPLLEDLDLSYTNCNDDTVAAVAETARNLQRLNLCHTLVTDLGVLSLCGDINQATAKCSKLEWLDINMTGVGEKCLTIALVKLKALTYINHSGLADLITNIHGSRSESHPVPPEDCYKLQVMEFQREKKDKGWLRRCVKTVCSYCPNLTDVSICDADEECIPPLVKLKQLQCLMLQTWQENKACLNMGGGLSYLLWGRGYNLKQLHLEGVQDIDLCGIGEWCSGLEILAITVPNMSPLASEPCSGPCRQENKHLYSKLKSISLSSWSNSFSYPFTSHALTVVLQGAVHLETIHFCNMSGLTDDVLSEALDTNPLACIQEVRLRGCDEISGDAMLQLLLTENNLHTLEISNCQLIGHYHADEMNAIIKDNNYSMEVHFTPYSTVLD